MTSQEEAKSGDGGGSARCAVLAVSGRIEMLKLEAQIKTDKPACHCVCAL